MLDKLRHNVLAWTTSAAATLTGFQVFAPTMIDWMLDIAVVCLVALAAKLAKSPSGLTVTRPRSGPRHKKQRTAL